MINRLGTSCIIKIQTGFTFKSNNEKLMSVSNEIVEMIQKRFPYMNYVGVPIFKEVSGTN
jgi:hypothetical protein